MCRMAAFISPYPLRGYEIDDFLDSVTEMASKGRTLRDTGMGHPHGWGMVAFREGRLLLYVRETCPIWRRGFYARFRADLVLVHARAASVGEVSFDNTHPVSAYKSGKIWFLAHNGSIKGIKEEGMLGQTDTEALLIRLLRQSRDISIQSVLGGVRAIREEFGDRISSMTFLMTSGNEIYALKGANEKQDYFNIYLRRGRNYVLSSQPLSDDAWIELVNWRLYRFYREEDRIVEESVDV